MPSNRCKKITILTFFIPPFEILLKLASIICIVIYSNGQAFLFCPALFVHPAHSRNEIFIQQTFYEMPPIGRVKMSHTMHRNAVAQFLQGAAATAELMIYVASLK